MKRSIFACQQCGAQSPKWLGRCGQCGAWDTLVEELAETSKGSAEVRPAETPRVLSEVGLIAGVRRETGLGELDRVLGGGLVRGSVVLIGGDPGIGKSTLALQAACALSERGAKVLYVAGEESAEQVKVRAARIGIGAAASSPWIVAETTLEALLALLDEMKPDAVVIDSVQTLASAGLGSAPGSVGQVREVSARLVTACKGGGMAAFLIGHVTKEGFLAGPRVLEHMVDTVLSFEGEHTRDYRILRAVKNRFGSTNEIGIFEMGDKGLREVANPSRLFLREERADLAGSVVTAAVEGTRPVLVEVQALCSRTAFGSPRRGCSGADGNRLAMLIAILEKKVGLVLIDQDVYLNLAGGIRVVEPAADLAILMAVASSFRSAPVDAELVVFGEVGLTGEVRGVSNPEVRVREAAKLGFRRCLLPKSSLEHIGAVRREIECTGIATITEALDRAFL